MDIEIVFHGVPSGQDYYGIKEEWANVELFYDGSTEPIKFVIETKKQGGKNYTYYTYLRYGLMGFGGRSGSYFGLTLRFDQYYQDVIHIYNLLEIVFKRHIIGTLLTSAGDAYKYTISSFSQKVTEVNQAQQALIQLVLSTCSPAKLMNMDDSFVHPITVAPAANIVDISEAVMLASIKKYSKVILSPVYETNIEKEYKKKLQEVEGKGGSIVAEKDKKIAEKESIISSLNSQIATQQTRISALEQEVKQKTSEIQQQKKKGELAQLVASIKEPITKMAEYFRIQDTQKHPPSLEYSRRNYILGIFSCGLLVFIFILCVCALFKNSGNAPVNTKKVGQLEAQVNSLNKEIQRLAGTLKLKDDTINDLRSKQPQQIVNAEQLRIDIDGKDIQGQKYSAGKTMSTGLTYTIKILKKDGSNISNNTGKWKLTNAILMNNSKETNAKITIQPITAGEVKFEYTPNDLTQFSTTRRTENAKEPSPESKEEAQITMTPNVKKVKDGISYTFTVTGYTGGGEWHMDGFSSGADRKQHQITVVANKEDATTGRAIINYYKEDGTQIKGGDFTYED